MKNDFKLIVGDEAQLRSQLHHVFKAHHQPALVEDFIQGRTMTVGVVGNLTKPATRRIPEDTSASRIFEELHFSPPSELDTAGSVIEETVLYLNQTHNDLTRNTRSICPAPLNEQQIEMLNWLAATAFWVMGCRDVARIDFRLAANDSDKPYILAINPLPGLSPDYSELCLEANAAGWRYEELINRILDEAVRRHQLNLPEAGLQNTPTLVKLPLVA